MQCQVGDVSMHYVEHGAGTPVLALHGAGVDHREIEAAIEAIDLAPDCRRIYPDLPGMGRSTTDSLTCNYDVVALLAAFIDQVAEEPVLVLGHSYGAYLARGLSAQHPELVRGLALLCPIAEHSTAVPEHEVVRHDADAHD